MNNLLNIQMPVKENLKVFYKEFSKILKTNVPLLNIITSYILKRKGKQLRPLLVFLSAKIQGEPNKSTYTAASLIELLHTASLIHDDVLDEYHSGHKIFSIKSLWKSKIAVLLGDFLLAKGLLIAVENKEYEILSIVSDAVREISEGELLQLQKSRKLNITEDEYFQIIRKKNATLLSSCTASGVKSVTNDLLKIDAMKEFGVNIGITFQIKDELSEYERKFAIGKPKVNDINKKKLTLPLIAAFSNASENKKNEIIRLINNKSLGKNDFKDLVKFIHEYNGISYAKLKMYHFRDKALQNLNIFENNESKKALENLINYITERKN